VTHLHPLTPPHLYFSFHPFHRQYPHFLRLLPFPTRRSSDLRELAAGAPQPVVGDHFPACVLGPHPLRPAAGDEPADRPDSNRHRSEEHTSELQSRENLVCRLLLEKKKTRARKDIPQKGQRRL